MLNVMGGRLVPMSLRATNRYFIPNWGRGVSLIGICLGSLMLIIKPRKLFFSNFRGSCQFNTSSLDVAMAGNDRYVAGCRGQRMPSSAMPMTLPSPTMRSALSMRYRVVTASNVTVCSTGLFCMLENSPDFSVFSTLPLASHVLTV